MATRSASDTVKEVRAVALPTAPEKVTSPSSASMLRDWAPLTVRLKAMLPPFEASERLPVSATEPL